MWLFRMVNGLIMISVRFSAILLGLFFLTIMLVGFSA